MAETGAPVPVVAIYRATLFKPSEPFITGQAGALGRHRPHLVGLVRAPSAPPPVDLTYGLAPPGAATAAALLAGRAPRALTAAVAAADPVLVHAHFGPDGTQVLPVCERLALPLVVTLHGHDVLVRGRPRSPQRVAYLLRRQRLLARADRVICVSDFLLRALRASGLPARAEVVRHHIGIDVEAIAAQAGASTDDREVIAFVGRLTAKKGVADLARIVRRLRRRGLRNPVEIIGDGPLAPIVAALADEVADVTWHRTRPHREALALFGRARLAILPSQTGPDGDAESLGLVFPEALASGCVPVGYRHGGVGEVVPDGLLCPEGDVEALADRAETILRSPAAAVAARAAGLETIRRRFDLRHQTVELEELYRDVAG